MRRSVSNLMIVFSLLFLMLQSAVSGELEEGFVAYKQGDKELAHKKWLALAIKGDARAQFFLSVYYEKQPGGKKSAENAKRWLTASANNGFIPAQFNLGNNFQNGNYGHLNYRKAEYWLEKAAVQGFSEAQYWLATIYYYGKPGVKGNLKEADYWFEQAAKGGHKMAIAAVPIVRRGGALPPHAETPENIAYDDKMVISELSFDSRQDVPENKQNDAIVPKPRKQEATSHDSALLPQQNGANTAANDELEASREVVAKTKVPLFKEQKGSEQKPQQQHVTYTIQLLASTAMHVCKSYSRGALDRSKIETEIQSFMRKGTEYCAVIYGSYGSYSQAKTDLVKLPSGIRKGKPWIRKLAR